jgi:hypothetical protein
MPTKHAAKGKPAKRDSQNSFRAQSNLEFPFCDYELKGRPVHQKLLTRNTTKGAKKLSAYEQHLLEKHFPVAEKKWMVAKGAANKARSAARRQQAKQAGLVQVGESDVDVEDVAASVPVFQRKAPEVLLRKISTLRISLTHHDHDIMFVKLSTGNGSR